MTPTQNAVQRLEHLKRQKMLDRAACNLVKAEIAESYDEALAIVREQARKSGLKV